MPKKYFKGKEKIFIFDTTLRDGEQASGFNMFPHEKMKIAKQLANLGVDIIEAGFAASSPGDFESIYNIAKEIGSSGPVICSLARAVDSDIEKAARALEPAIKNNKGRIHTFIATSDIHIDYKFKKDREWVISKAVEAIKKATQYTDDVEFSCEDFGRTDKKYAVEIICEAIKAGARTINLPDTVGWLLPYESYQKVRYVLNSVRENGLDAIFSVHNHDDFGMATATTIEAIRAGVRQVEGTINGIGERAGNVALEEIIAILKEKEIFETNVRTELIGETSRLIAKITGIEPQPNKAIVGRNAFAHESGIHQDGMIKNKKTYEIMDPKKYGVESIITLGRRSGRNALWAKYQSLGIELSEEEFQKTAIAFTSLSDKLKEIDDADVVRCLKNGEEIPEYYQFQEYHPVTNGKYGAVMKLKVGSGVKTAYAEGNGQIDSAINAIRGAINANYELADFRVESKGNGSDAVGYTRLKVLKNGWQVIGKNENTDVVTSSIKAFIDGCNRIKYLEDYFKK